MTVCACGHTDHASTEPRVCMNWDCHCIQFRASNPYSHLLSTVDIYLEKMTTAEQRMEWVLTNLPFFRNYNNFDLVINYWKYILHYDMETEFLVPQMRKVIESLGQPETITRTRRGLVELHPELFAPLDSKVADEKGFKQFGIMEWAIARK